MGTEIFGLVVLVITIELIAFLSAKLTKNAAIAIVMSLVITIMVVVFLNLISEAGRSVPSFYQLLSVGAIALLLSTPTILYALKNRD